MAFPRTSQEWNFRELSAARRLSLSAAGCGLATGVVVRMYRWGALAFVREDGGPVVLVLLLVGIGLLCGLATLHLANFTIRSWWRRAPLLGVFIAAGESGASLILTVLGEERFGAEPATLAEWPATAFSLLFSRVLVVSLYALVLAVVVVALRARLWRDG